MKLAGQVTAEFSQGILQVVGPAGHRVLGASGVITIAAAGVPATLDAGTTAGRISNALQNAGGAPGLSIHATTTVGDITARSL